MRKGLQTIASVMCIAAFATVAQAEDMKARGVVRSLAEATISVDQPVRITGLPVLEGQAFAAGDVLATFDCRRFNAEVAAADANARALSLVFSNNKRLLARGAIGANDVQVSQAQSEKANAERDVARARTATCDYRAPFEGRLLQRIAQEEETHAANQPLFRIVDTGRIEVEAIVPSRWLRWLKAGDSSWFVVDDTGEAIRSEVIRVGAAVDAVSQTVKVFLKFKEKQTSVLPGMSGVVLLPRLGS